MAKKNSLGRDIDKSIDIMDDLLGCLKKFTDMPLKKGLQGKGLDDKELKDLIKIVDSASEVALSLKNNIENIENAVASIRVPDNSRFASNVVKRYLESSYS